jgi:hypothetical protein
MTDLLQYIVALVGIVTCFSIFALSFNLFFADKEAYEANKVATGSLKQALKGTLSGQQIGSSGYRVHAGMAIENGKLIRLGGLSSEAISTVLKSS